MVLKSIMASPGLTPPILGSNPLGIVTSTAKTVCYQGEQLPVHIHVPAETNLFFTSAYTYDYTLNWDGGSYRFSAGKAYPQPILHINAPLTFNTAHPWNERFLGIGQYSLVGEVPGYGASEAVHFEVIEAPRAEGNFLIDFATIPGTDAPMAHLKALEASGVQFVTVSGAKCQLHRSAERAYVRGFDAYPIGFHVTAQFDRTVYAVRAKVAAGLGHTITMTARNSLGEVIGTNTSPPTEQLRDFKHAVFVAATEPIASVEWFPNSPQSTALVTDVQVITTPALKTRIEGNTLDIMWAGKAGSSYQLERSTDLRNWAPVDSPRHGANQELSWGVQKDGTNRFFYRLRQEQTGAE